MLSNKSYLKFQIQNSKDQLEIHKINNDVNKCFNDLKRDSNIPIMYLDVTAEAQINENKTKNTKTDFNEEMKTLKVKRNEAGMGINLRSLLKDL